MSTKNEMFKARISEIELKNLEKNCKNMGVNKSEYFRLTCCSAEDKQTALLKNDIIRAKNELKRIGINLNQIAKNLNKTGDINKSNIFDIQFMDEYKKTMEIINNLIRK